MVSEYGYIILELLWLGLFMMIYYDYINDRAERLFKKGTIFHDMMASAMYVSMVPVLIFFEVLIRHVITVTIGWPL